MSEGGVQPAALRRRGLGRGDAGGAVGDGVVAALEDGVEDLLAVVGFVPLLLGDFVLEFSGPLRNSLRVES